MKFLFIIISILFLNNSSVLHKDTPLQIEDNGNIIGLPKAYGLAKFDLENGYLKIKNKEIIFPHCVRYYFDIHDQPRIYLSASWYHSKEIMPYYLNFEISAKDKDYSYKILVDLETLELIYVNISIQQGNSTYNHKIDLKENCLTEYKNGIKTSKTDK